MAIVSLGTRALEIGKNPIVFDPFDFKVGTTYGVFGRFLIANPNNIFSFASMRPLIQIPDKDEFLGEGILEQDIQPTRFFLRVPFYNLYDGDGTCRIQVERISRFRGSAEADSPVTLELSYDDKVTGKL